ncbi:hypothetical protein CWB73_14305 [Pseudoalteromonas phenolica]|uniref:DUF4405 domain-containing protein n=1 Tax=Pseudoalteromonas phenolica TaxID=161398 RepID=A0A5S3YQY6_9GAMM|nr:DUF4405 domain-containing protein [Pseudoalteromonas phenolica]TMP79283.1 hypothetical protein CWB73_14305 [Pseudoalteromonas phenolica]
MSFFNARVFIGTLLFLAFIVMLVTSVLLYSQQHDAVIALIHTLIGAAMILVVVWHLFKNSKPLFAYLNPFKKHMGKVSFAMPLAVLLIGYLLASPFFALPPAMQVYTWGQTLKAADKADQDKELKYVERVITPAKASGQTITLELKKGPYFMWPQYAFWLETLEGKFIQPLYVTEKIATNNFTNKVSKVDPEQVFDAHLLIGENAIGREALTGGEDAKSKDTRMRPESLPVFLHQLGVQASNGYYLPTDNKLVVDGFSGATMTDNFIYSIQLPTTLTGQYRIRFEINHSFDYNTYYSSDRFPDDPVYSGDGYTAQPSLIYQAIVDFDQPNKLQQMQLIGHGHHSGKDGDVRADLSNFTTALELVDRILVSHSL